jgi:hypothetical protein
MDEKPTPEDLAGWKFWKAAPTSAERTEITATELIAALRTRDIYALCQHGAISHAGARFYSELK